MARKQINVILLLGLVLFSCAKPEPAVAQERRERVEFSVDGLFQGVYSEVLEQPLEVTYTVPCADGDASRTGLDFFEDPNIHTSDDDDYSNNVWDKGHLAPAAAFSCDRETIKKTFTYLNSALQHQSLNRGIWNRLEAVERGMAIWHDVNVKIEVIFDENSQVLPSGATVPRAFRKTIEAGGKTIVFYFPNIDTSGTDWQDYIVKN
jgi:DNA/RNA endonuclease G (NUC1)